MAAGDIMIKIELRPCLIAENEKGLFHKWIKELNGTTKGFVEDIRGRIHLVRPEQIQFLDNEIQKYDFNFNAYEEYKNNKTPENKDSKIIKEEELKDRERSHKDALDSWLYLIELYYKNADKILPFSYIESIERKTKGVFGGYNG